MVTTPSECSQPRVGLLTKEPWRVHSSPPSCPPSTRAFLAAPSDRAFLDAPPSRFMSCIGGRGGGEGAVRGAVGRWSGGEEPELLRSPRENSTGP